MEIYRDISVEELVEKYPFAVRFLAEKGIRCIACGEPLWGTLEEACIEKGLDKNKIDSLMAELNLLIKSHNK